MPTDGAEVIYSSVLTIRDAKEMATLCVFYDKVYLPHTTREGSRKYYALEGASGIELVGFENVNPAGHRRFVEDVNIWDDAYRALRAEGVVERLPPFDWQVPDVARMLTELAMGHPSLAANLFLNAPPARFSIAGVDFTIMKQDLALHFLRPDLGAAQLFSGAEKRPSRELMIAFEAKVVFSYLLPALAELNAEQILEVRGKVKDTREGFAMHLQKLSKGISDRLYRKRLAKFIFIFMVYRNESLYSAAEAYVRAALDFIAEKAGAQATTSELHEDDYFFTRVNSAGDLTKLPEYQPCLEALAGDPVIARQLDVMAGTNARRSRAPSAEQLMREILDLGVNDGRYEFDSEHFGREYAAFEEAYYSPDILYEVVAPLQGLLRGSRQRKG